MFSPVVSRKFATLKKKMEIVTHADCSSSSGSSSGNSSGNSSNNNNNTGAAAATAADDDDGGGGGGGDDDDGDYSEEEDIDEFIDWALAVDAKEAERAALEAYHSNFGGGYSGGDRASASVLYSRVVDGAGTRSEPIAMLAEIATWTYSPAPPRASEDSVVEHTGL
jgi:hypothetical protein